VKQVRMVKAAVCCVLCGMLIPAIPAAAQTRSAQVFSRADVQRELQVLEATVKAKGSGGMTLGDYSSHKLMLSERSTTGEAEVHAHFDDIMVVIDGSATLITGGHLIDAHTRGDGESKGTGIRGGVKQEVATGDIIHIPAGTPHLLIIPRGVIFGAFVVKVRE